MPNNYTPYAMILSNSILQWTLMNLQKQFKIKTLKLT